jgi:threonine/homoserine/homoserine lactone efflux protein
MHDLSILLTVASLWLVAAVTPGPNSILVMRVSVVRSRTDGLQVVSGIGLGTGIWGLSGFFGVHALFLAAPLLYWLFRVCGGLYLIFFGLRLVWKCLRGEEAMAPAVGGSASGPFRLGLITSLSNPKSALSVASLFAATMPSHAPIDLGLMTVALMVAISTGWYALMVCLFSSRWMAAAHRRLRRVIDGIAGAIFVAFGARLVLQR